MKCRDCKHYEGDERRGICRRARLADGFALAFANEGEDDTDDCDMAEARPDPGEEGRHDG